MHMCESSRGVCIYCQKRIRPTNPNGFEPTEEDLKAQRKAYLEDRITRLNNAKRHQRAEVNKALEALAVAESGGRSIDEELTQVMVAYNKIMGWN